MKHTLLLPSGGFISINEASNYTTRPWRHGPLTKCKLQSRKKGDKSKKKKKHPFFTNVAEFSQRYSMPVFYCVVLSLWLSTAVMPLRWCQHKSKPYDHCRRDGTVEKRSHNLWLCSVDSIWLLFTPELSCVDTKWLSHSGRQWEKPRESVCYQANIGTHPLKVITQKTHSHQTNCLIPGLPLSALLLSSTSFEKNKTKHSQKVTSLDLRMCWN